MTAALRVIVVDDERISRVSTVQQLRAAGHVAEEAATGAAALALMEALPWDVVLTDLRMPCMSGLELLAEIKRLHPTVDVMLMTAFGAVDTALEAMRLGASDYLTKPFRFTELEVRLARIQEQQRTRVELTRLQGLLDEERAWGGVVGGSPALRKVFERAALFADSAAPVLVVGETGTGKELISRAIHDRGPRRRGPFVPLHCGTIPRELAESHILGHEKGAFTGASLRRRGCFEQAHGGTLLLDDIDDLPLDIQVKLLRVLQEGVVTRVGGERELPVDVRVIATTKIDLAQAVASGTFRGDLFYRLRGLELHLPALRTRGDDVLLLAQHFLRVIASDTGAAVKHLSPDAAEVLKRHAWPGNVRELRRVMETATVLCAGDVIDPGHLPDYLAEGGETARERLYTLHLEHRDSIALQDVVEAFEQDVIAWALTAAQGQQTRAAELLGIPRTTLQSKLKLRGG